MNMIFGALIIPVLFAVLAGSFFLQIMTAAVMFSKVVVGLLVAWLISNEVVLVASSGLLNFLAWGGIVFAAGFLLSFFPRVNGAYQFFSTALITFFCSFIVYGLAASIFFGEAEVQLTAEIVMKVISLGFAAYATWQQFEESDGGITTNPILAMVERIIASFIYGITIMVIVASSNVWGCTDFIAGAVLIGTFVLTFLLDRFLLTNIYMSGRCVLRRGGRGFSVPSFGSGEDDLGMKKFNEEMDAIDRYYKEKDEEDDYLFWKMAEEEDRKEQQWQDDWDRQRDDDFYRNNDSW